MIVCLLVCACVLVCVENFPNKDASAKTQAGMKRGGLAGMATFSAARVDVVVVVVAAVVVAVDSDVLSNLGKDDFHRRR